MTRDTMTRTAAMTTASRTQGRSEMTNTTPLDNDREAARA
jgi:hypothetical protein